LYGIGIVDAAHHHVREHLARQPPFAPIQNL
jgi:hypothetical protein